VGPYTAAAIASIAFGLPHAVVDGNVLRVIARLKNDPGDIAQGGTRARFQAIADQLLDHGDAGRYNQALMELGATICLARAPQCLLCPVARDCQSLDAGTVHLVPVKGRGKERQNLSAAVAIVERHGRVLLRQRAADARLMAGFWELPPPDELPGFEARKNLGTVRHTITHHHYTVTVVSGELPRAPRGCRWVGRPMLGRIPLTTLARKALAIGG
jgi:A/G-specific adenine glycosylase